MLNVNLNIIDYTSYAKSKKHKIVLEITEKKEFWFERIDKLLKERTRVVFDDGIDCQWCGENIDIYLNYLVYRGDEGARSILIDYLKKFNGELSNDQRKQIEKEIDRMCKPISIFASDNFIE